jgi:uncharacterized protein (DUF362 family)
MQSLTRRQFLSLMGKSAASGYVLLNVDHWSRWPLGKRGLIATGQGPDCLRILSQSLDALGGATHLASPGDVVAIKPTMAWNSPPAEGLNTSPEVVRALAQLCLDAGARMVKVFDRTSFRPDLCYRVSRIPQALAELGSDRVQVLALSKADFVPLQFADGSMPTRQVCRHVLEADRLVNVGTARYHASRGLSLTMPNLIGSVGGGPVVDEWDCAQEVVGVAKILRPDLSVLDATRVRVGKRHSGGAPGKVQVLDTVAVSQDMVALDGFGCALLNQTWRDVDYLRLTVAQGFGEPSPRLNEIHRVS